MKKRPVLGLGRHKETEVFGGGASPGTRYLFSSMEEQLQRHFTLVRVPPYYYSADPRRALRVAIDVLNRVDACLFGLAGPFHLDPFFLVRDRLEKRTPFIYMPLGEFPRGACLYRNIHRYLRPQDVMLFSSRADREIHDALVASTPARIVVVSFGIQSQFFRTPAEMRAATRRHLGIERDDVVFVYHGRVTTEKNVHGAMMMFRRIARDHPRTRLWIVGELPGDSPREFGPLPLARLPANQLTNAFRDLLQDEQIAERVVFWGDLPREAVPRVLGAADIGINLTLNGDENFGYSTVEAMAAGLPVIGTDWGGLKDTIEDGVTGFLVPTIITSIGVGVDHWSAWQGAVTLVENVKERDRMSAAARLRANRHFSLDRFVDSIADEIRTQISSNGSRSQTHHVWTALGKQLFESYSITVPGDAPRTLPGRIPAGATLFREYPLMRKVLAPYATKTQIERPDRHAVFFLATELIDLRGGAVISKDPRYVFKLKPVDAADRAVIRILQSSGFCDRSNLSRRATPRFDSKTIEASLRRLLRAGIVLQSVKHRCPSGGERGIGNGSAGCS